MKKLMPRPETIAAAIRATQDKIKNGYPKGVRYFDMPCDTQTKIGGVLSDLRKHEPALLEKIKANQVG